VDPDADKLMDEFVKVSDEAKQKEIMNQIEALFVKDAPALPLYPQVDWYEYSTAHFTGWPDKDNAYAPGTPFQSPNGIMSALPLLTTIKPK
jgi:peptide/nickel transport system substrate-binding protein